MKFGSVCSGIEAASVAFEPLGFTAQWFSEIEHFPSEVLKYRYPTVPNLGDMTKLTENETFRASSIDLLVGGTPCQSFSVAGLRGGLADPRGNLMLTFLSLADAKKPRWIVWENVPGVLSSNGGKDFGTFLGALGELGYGFAYRVLDAQHFGVAQRRRRVFVVGYLGDWRPAAAVLFERHSLSGHPAPRREKREGVAAFTPSSFGKYGPGVGTLKANGGDYGGGSETLIAGNKDVSDTVTAKWATGSGGPSGDEMQNKVLHPFAVDTYNYSVNEHTSRSLTAGASDSNHTGAVIVSKEWPDQTASTLNARFGDKQGYKDQYALNGAPVIIEQIAKPIPINTMAIRRLTPKECERLQGFPDDFTKIPYRNKPADQCPDGPRYKACGNSMAVPVMRWIGKRIQLIDTIIN